MIVLKNKTNRMRVYNLDRHHGTIRKFPQIRALANGGSIGEMVKRKLPDSITFLAGELKSKWQGKPLPDSILSCPDIDAAIQRGEIVQIDRIVDRSVYKDPVPAAPAPAPTLAPATNNDPVSVASEPSVSDDSGTGGGAPKKSAKPKRGNRPHNK